MKPDTIAKQESYDPIAELSIIVLVLVVSGFVIAAIVSGHISFSPVG